MGQRIISFTGAQSTGKTTLLNNIRQEDIHTNKFFFVDEVTRIFDRQKIDINNQADNYNLTQSLIINSHLENFYLTDKAKDRDIILDRCIVDGYIYTYYLFNHGKVSHNIFRFAEHWFREMIGKYDYILYTDPKDVELVDDGTRSIDKYFRDEIIELYDRYIFGLHYDNVHVISGNVAERLEEIRFLLEDKIPCRVCDKPTIYGVKHPEPYENKQNFQINGSHFCETCYNGAYNLI